jgi:hypothetical protein
MQQAYVHLADHKLFGVMVAATLRWQDMDASSFRTQTLTVVHGNRDILSSAAQGSQSCVAQQSACMHASRRERS